MDQTAQLKQQLKHGAPEPPTGVEAQPRAESRKSCFQRRNCQLQRACWRCHLRPGLLAHFEASGRRPRLVQIVLKVSRHQLDLVDAHVEEQAGLE